MLHEFLLSCLLLVSYSSAASPVCDQVRRALTGYTEEDYAKDIMCAYEKQTLTITGVFGPTPYGTLNKISSVADNPIRNLKIDWFVPEISADSLDNLSDLVDVSFEDNGIRRLPPKLFSKLTSLKRLALSGSRLEQIVPLADLPRGLQNMAVSDTQLKRLAGFTNLPHTLTTLRMSKNKLTSFVMEPAADYPPFQLINLYMDDNQIKEYYTPGFAQLIVLSLTGNLLSEVSSDMLQGLGELSHLYLNKNRIRAIEAGAFAHTRRLVELDLAENDIRVLDDNFAVPSLGTLRINHNRLQYLDLKLFVRSDRFTTITLHGNPFNCGCLEQLLEWLDSYGVKLQCRNNLFSGIAPSCVVHSRDNLHYCPYRYFEEDAEYFLKDPHVQSLINNTCTYF